MKTKIAIVDED